jgi:hypothetical protein
VDSIEKIHQLAREYSGAPDPNAEGLELAMRTAVSTMGPMFLQLLPDDPAFLDAALEEMAIRLLHLRSDGARVVQLANADLQPLELPAGT